MNLPKLLGDYRRDRGIREVTANRMRRSIAVYGEFLGHTATTKDLTRDRVNDWLCWLIERYKPKSAREFRADLMALWRYSADGSMAEYPFRIRIVRVERPIPQAWTPDEARKLFAACYQFKHGAYLSLLMRVIYETGMRRKDALQLTADDIGENEIISFTQHKTSDGHAVRLTPQTAELVRQRGDMRPPVGVRRIYRLLDQICQRAGIRHGAMQRMRRTGATQVERVQPGAAMQYLGHRTPGLAWLYYIDRTQLTMPVQPPEL